MTFSRSSMNEIAYLKSTLATAEDIFKKISEDSRLERPQYVSKDYRFEHTNKNVPTFLIVSLARLLSLSNALLLLTENKFLQEVGIMIRCIDETSSNIHLLIHGLSEKEDIRRVQDRLLADFYKYPYEDADKPYPVIAKYNGPQSNEVRKAHLEQSGLDTTLDIWEGNVGGLYKLFSKHVHGNYYAAIELYSGKGNTYDTNGSSVKELYQTWMEQVPSLIYRTVFTCQNVAMSMGMSNFVGLFSQLTTSMIEHYPGIDGSN